MTIDELVGENLRRAREAVGISRRDLAHRVAAVGLPLSEADLESLEVGSAPASVDALVALGLALGVPPGLLLAPLNLGALLCVDGEGRATASWSLFHSWARPFSPVSPPSALAPGGAGAVAEDRPAAPAAPATAAPAAATSAAASPDPAGLPAPPPAGAPDPPPHPEEGTGDLFAEVRPAAPSPPAAPPAPVPVPQQTAPWPPDPPPERDWALQALRELHQVR